MIPYFLVFALVITMVLDALHYDMWKKAARQRDDALRRLALISKEWVPLDQALALEHNAWVNAVAWAAGHVIERGIKIKGAIDPRLTSLSLLRESAIAFSKRNGSQ